MKIANIRRTSENVSLNGSDVLVLLRGNKQLRNDREAINDPEFQVVKNSDIQAMGENRIKRNSNLVLQGYPTHKIIETILTIGDILNKTPNSEMDRNEKDITLQINPSLGQEGAQYTSKDNINITLMKNSQGKTLVS